MSERASHSPEAHKQHHSPEHQAEHHEHQRARQEREPRHEAKEHAPVPELEQRAHQEAIAGKEMIPAAQEKPKENTAYVSRELKKNTLNRTLARIRKQLPASSRTLSKVVHQPVVDAVSQVGGQTIARPSGLLGGSIVAFVGSSIFLWMANHYGFTYNYLLFAILFVGGFAVGMALEFLIAALRRKQLKV